MKKILLLSLITLFCEVTATAQSSPRQHVPTHRSRGVPGYVTINEFQFGFGLGDVSVPYSRSLIGFTTMHGYVINNLFTIGGGTGISFYNGGTLVPLFLDVRYHHDYNQSFVPFFFGNGGFLIDVNDFNSGTKLFLNAGPGVSYAATRNLAFNLGSGLLIQMGNQHRYTFINFKLGVTYKLN